MSRFPGFRLILDAQRGDQSWRSHWSDERTEVLLSAALAGSRSWCLSEERIPLQHCDAHVLRGVVEASAEVSLLRSRLRRTSRAEETVVELISHEDPELRGGRDSVSHFQIRQVPNGK